MEALREGDKQTFRKLASEDSQVRNRKGPAGITPLMQAVLYGDCDAVRLLLAKGVDPNIRNEAGATALMWAVADPEKTRLLLEHGADVNARSDDGRTTLLIAAGQFGNNEVVKLLLDRGASLSEKSPAGRGYSTPLSEAASVDNAPLLRMLIERESSDGRANARSGDEIQLSRRLAQARPKRRPFFSLMPEIRNASNH
jgi:ankyrin repeat protein